MDTTSSIIVFDVETTGLKAEKDRVIELCIQFGIDDQAKELTWRFNPGMPIAAEATKVHGISNADVADAPAFSELAPMIRQHFEAAEVLVGYNMRFDLEFMQAEFARAKQPLIPLKDKKLVDPFLIWRKKEPRTLTAAHERFAGATLENSHSATADVRGTGKVLSGMLKAFDMSELGWDKVSEYCELQQASRLGIGPSAHLKWQSGLPSVAFGKHKNKALAAIAQEDNGSYLRWMSSADFPQHVKLVASKALEMSSEELTQWVTKEYGAP